MSLISVENVVFSYEKNRPVLDGVSFNVEKGEYIALIGHNGSGKSTLSRLLNGLLIPESGKVVVDGFDTTKKSSLFEVRKRVGVVFQNPDNQLVASIVEDDVAFGPENLGLNREEIAERIEFALSSVGMENFRHSSPERLSGGQKQRIAIAGVLALKPLVLVLDESTSMLDPAGRKEVLNVVKKLNAERGVSVIAVTHYMDEVIDADRVIVLDHGKIALSGTPEYVFSKKDAIKALGLELPLSTQIAEKLKENGVKIDSDILSKDALAEVLCKLSQKI